MVRISVIIPVYNVERYLPETLDCLAGQSFADAEFILVNDGSKDSSLSICRRYASVDPRFVVIDQENGGPARARNTGLDAASGEYICFMDADDLLAEEALRDMYESVQGYDVLIHGTEFIGDYDEVPAWIRDASNIKPATYDDFSIKDIYSLNGCGPVLWLHFIKADLIQKEHLRINERLFIGEDFSFAVNYLSNAKKVRFVSDKFYSYRLFRQGSLMTTYQDKPKEKLDQSLLMSRVMYESIKDKIRTEDEPAMIQQIIVFNFRDFYRLLTDDRKAYAVILEVFLDGLHIGSHLRDLPGIIIMMYGYIRGIEDGSVKMDSTDSEQTSEEYWNMFMH